MINELYISIVFRPQPIAAGRIVDMFSRQSKAQLEELQLEHIENMEDLISTSMAALDRYEPELLGCYEFKGNLFSETGEFLHYILNGEWRRFPLPRAEMRDVLPTSRPFFGKGGLMSLRTSTEDYFCATLAFQEYPAYTHPGLLNELLSVPYEFTVCVRRTHLESRAVIEDRPHEGDRGDDGTIDRWRAPAAARVQRRFQGVGSGTNP